MINTMFGRLDDGSAARALSTEITHSKTARIRVTTKAIRVFKIVVICFGDFAERGERPSRGVIISRANELDCMLAGHRLNWLTI